jgi:hypothetical protein
MLDPHFVKQLLHPPAGSMLLEAELGVLVEITPDLDHPGQEIPRRRENF